MSGLWISFSDLQVAILIKTNEMHNKRLRSTQPVILGQNN